MARKCNKIDEQTRKAWSDAAAQAAKIRHEEQRIAKMAHVTITVGARRSCHFYPAAPKYAHVDDGAHDRVTKQCYGDRSNPTHPAGVMAQENADQRARQLEIDAAIYHSPLDTRPPRPRKPGKPLAACEAAGKRAIGADDRKDCKRPVAVAIPYVTEAGETVVAIFGGLTQAQADDARRGNGGIPIAMSACDECEDGSHATFVYRGRIVKGRVVIWPSEAIRRGAATACTVDADATVDDLRREYPVIDERPAEVQRLIDLHDERAAEYRHAA